MNIDDQDRIACTCDLLNSWARELGVAECKNPFDGLALRDLADRLWSKTSGNDAALRARIEFLSEDKT